MQQETSWYLLGDPQVCSVVYAVARATAAKNNGVLSIEDLEQEGAIAVITDRNCSSLAAQGEYRLLYNALSQKVFNIAVRPLLRTGAMDSMRLKTIDPVEVTMDRDIEVDVTFDGGPGGYNPDMIQMLLPAVWDEGYTYGLPRQESAPDADMPKGSTNKATSNNLAAYIADIKTGWYSTPLTDKERIAVLLRVGLDWTFEEVASNQGVSKSVIHARVNTALNKVARFLNGTEPNQTTDRKVPLDHPRNVPVRRDDSPR